MTKQRIMFFLTGLLASVSLPCLASTNLSCAKLQSQLQAKLPTSIFKLITWNQNTCSASLVTSGATLKKAGLQKDFIVQTLKQLHWQNGPKKYDADSAMSHQQALIKSKQLLIISYNFTPSANACPTNQPLSACVLPQDKMIYTLQFNVSSN